MACLDTPSQSGNFHVHALHAGGVRRGGKISSPTNVWQLVQYKTYLQERTRRVLNPRNASLAWLIEWRR
jgi:hypothetical protein